MLRALIACHLRIEQACRPANEQAFVLIGLCFGYRLSGDCECGKPLQHVPLCRAQGGSSISLLAVSHAESQLLADLPLQLQSLYVLLYACCSLAFARVTTIGTGSLPVQHHSTC